MKRWSLVVAVVLAGLGSVAYVVHDRASLAPSTATSPPAASSQPTTTAPANAAPRVESAAQNGAAPAPASAEAPPAAARAPEQTPSKRTPSSRQTSDAPVPVPRQASAIKPARPAASSEPLDPADARVEQQKRMNRALEAAACRAPDVERRLAQLSADERAAFRERCARLGITVPGAR